MRQAFKTVIAAVLILGLFGCTDPLSDLPTLTTPAAQTSTVETQVGEPVHVTLETNLQAANSQASELKSARLGACFTLSPRTTSSGACSGLPTPLPAALQLLDGTSFEKVYGPLIIEAGRDKTFTHTFTITSSRPETVSIGAQSSSKASYSGYIEQEAIITFK